jgi:hypothetical protein
MKFLFGLTGLLMASVTTAAEAQDLPQGELQVFAGTDTSANFLVVGEESRNGDEVEVSLFTVYVNGIRTQTGVITQTVSRVSINCQNRTRRDIYVRGFSATGDLIDTLPPSVPEPIEPNDTFDFVARMHCDGVQIQPGPVVGHAAAVALARQRLLGRD